MPRQGHPWYRSGRRMWFATIGGVKTPLGISDPADEAGAVLARQNLIDDLAAAVAAKVNPPPPPPGPPGVARAGEPPGRTVAAAVAEYLALVGRKVAAGKVGAGSAKNYALALGHLAAAFGPRPLAGLTADELEQWADRPDWSPSYRNGTLGTVCTLLKWAGVALKVARPPKESRGAEVALTDEQFALVLREACRIAVPGDLRELLTVMRETGGRPQEVARLRVESVDWRHGCTILHQHKTKKKTGKNAVIHFSEAALAVLARQRERYGTGFLFRTRAGNPYSPGAIVRRMLVVSKRVGFRAIAYGTGRHSFATKALESGVPDVVVAALLRHRDTKMVHEHYSHVGENARLLKEAVEKTSKAAG